MDIRDKIISEIQLSAHKVLVIPLGEFLSSDAINYMDNALGTEKYHILIELIKSIYGVSEIFTNDDFNLYSLENIWEINLIYSKIITNIKYLKEFTQYRHRHSADSATKIFNDIKIYYDNIEAQLQKCLVDAETKSAPSEKGNQTHDIYTKAGRDRATKEIKTLASEQLETPIEELMSSEVVMVLSKGVVNKGLVIKRSQDEMLRLFQKSYTVLRIMSLSSLSYFTSGDLINIIENTQATISLLRQIKKPKFQIDSNKIDQAENIVGKIESLLTSITSKLDPCITDLMYEIIIKPDLLPAFVKFNESRNESEKLNYNVNSVLKLLGEKIEDIKKLELRAEEATSIIGTSALAVVFTDQSKKSIWESRGWLLVTTALAGYAYYYADCLLKNDNSYPDMISMLPDISLRVFILGILITATFWCGRNFRALRHQSAVNQERSAMIRTFRAFAESAEDQKIKDIVLTEAMRSVFTPSPPGFVDQSSERDSHGAINVTNDSHIAKHDKGG